MIVARYLLTQWLASFALVLVVLLAIMVLTRFAGYLGEAAAGKYTADFVVMVMVYKLPEFVTIVAPLSFFLALSLVLGRLYSDHELTVLHALGLSRRRLCGLMLIAAALVATAVAALSLIIAPAGNQALEALRIEQRSRPELDRLGAGRFQPLESGSRVTYVEGLSDDGLTLENVFIAETGAAGEFVLLRARRGRQHIDEAAGLRYLQLEDGERIEGTPGVARLRRTRFATLTQRIVWSPIRVVGRLDRVSTPTLLGRDDAEAAAELQWRLSLPLTVPVLGLLAVAGSAGAATRGGTVRLVPSIAALVGYVAALMVLREQIGEGAWPVVPGMAPVHLVFLAIGLAWTFGWRPAGGRRRSDAPGGRKWHALRSRRQQSHAP